MQPIIANSNSAGSNNTNGFTKNVRTASHERHSDDYIDLELRKGINLWFKKNSSSGNQPGMIEPTNSYPIKRPLSTINLGYSGE